MLHLPHQKTLEEPATQLDDLNGHAQDPNNRDIESHPELDHEEDDEEVEIPQMNVTVTLALLAVVTVVSPI